MTPEEKDAINRCVALLAHEGVTIVGAGSVSSLFDYCTDPIAGNHLLDEIERRGWEPWLYRYLEEWKADIQRRGESPNDFVQWEVSESSTESRWHALALAFIAACEQEVTL